MLEVVAGVIYKEDKFLIAQRNLKKTQGRFMGISRRKNRSKWNSRRSVSKRNKRRVWCRYKSYKIYWREYSSLSRKRYKVKFL